MWKIFHWRCFEFQPIISDVEAFSGKFAALSHHRALPLQRLKWIEYNLHSSFFLQYNSFSHNFRSANSMHYVICYIGTKTQPTQKHTARIQWNGYTFSFMSSCESWMEYIKYRSIGFSVWFHLKVSHVQYFALTHIGNDNILHYFCVQWRCLVFASLSFRS